MWETLRPTEVKLWWARRVGETAAHPNAGLAYAEGGRYGPRSQYKANTMKKPLIPTLLAATIASVILVAPGSAGKPVYSVTCVVGTGGLTTMTWISGTTSAHVVWRDVDSTPLDEADITVTTHGPDGTAIDTPATAANARAADVNFDGKKLGHALGACASA